MPRHGFQMTAFRGDVREGVRRGRGRYTGAVAPGVPVERVQRPEEPTVHGTWPCPNSLCREWTRPSHSADGASCHACGEPRPAHLTARAEQAAAVRRAAVPMREAA